MNEKFCFLALRFVADILPYMTVRTMKVVVTAGHSIVSA